MDAFGRIDVVVNAARSADPTVEHFTVDSFARAHDRQGTNDPGEIALLILQTAEMAEPPVRLLVGPEATHYLADESQSLREFEAKWRN